MEEMVVVTPEKLEKLMKQKLEAAGLHSEHAEEVARHLTFADASGIHSHGAVRMDYYAERIAKGGITIDPELSFEKLDRPLFHGDNGVGQFVCNEALAAAVDLAKESGVAYVGVSQTSHSGTLSYYVKKQRNKAWLLFRCVNLIQWWYRLVVQAIILGQIQSLLQHLEQVMNQSCLIWLRQYRRGENFRCTFKRC